MRFSICIPTHRIDNRLKRTLKSLELLDYPKHLFDICLFINGTNDVPESGFDCVETDQLPLGPSGAKNRVVSMSRSEWIIMLDGDDFLVPSALQQYASYLHGNPEAVFVCEPSMINFIGPEGGKQAFFPAHARLYQDFFEHNLQFMERTAACGHPTLVKKSEFIPYNTGFTFAEERRLVTDYWKAGKTVHIMGTSTYVYNWNETGATQGVSLHELPPEKRDLFKKFTDSVAQEEKTPLLSLPKSFSVPDAQDIEAIKLFLDWENRDFVP